MDLLGSILGSMDSSLPTTKMDDETRRKVQEAKASQMKFRNMERKKMATFRTQIETQLNNLLTTTNGDVKKVFQPMDKVHRSIIHEVAETAGLLTHSFGEEEIDKHVIVWRKEHAPCEAELQALRSGEVYDPEKTAAEEKLKAEVAAEAEKESRKRKASSPEEENEKYFEKYAKIVGGSSGLDAAHTTKADTTYGMVPSRNKEDTRSIEETMNEISERKKQRQLLDSVEGISPVSLSSSSLTSNLEPDSSNDINGVD